MIEPATLLPMGAAAHAPAEASGGRRDSVRLMVSSPGVETAHARFWDLPSFLRPGDLVVVNTSATWPAALPTRGPDGERLLVHLSTRLPAERWLVELRVPADAASRPYPRDLTAARLSLPAGGAVELVGYQGGSRRLYVARVLIPGDLAAYLDRWGRPVRYDYVSADWPISYYQTVYATTPGSAEMPSAGRPFTAELVTALVASGVSVAPLLLHTGVSSLEGDEAPYPEWFAVSEDTARQVNSARAAGRRVVAVGTTVVRALESAHEQGQVRASSGWTDLVVTPARGVRVVDALLTGLHDPRASHLQMLRAFAPETALRSDYDEAARRGYRWHEFGDSHLLVRGA